MPASEPLIRLAQMREVLQTLMQPEVLQGLADFLEATGGDNSFIVRYQWFCENAEKGPDCRYAAISKELFLKNEAENVAKAINWLYHSWSKHYE